MTIDRHAVEDILKEYTEILNSRAIEHFSSRNVDKVPPEWRSSVDSDVTPLSLLSFEKLVEQNSYDRNPVVTPVNVHEILCQPSCSHHQYPKTFPPYSSMSTTRTRVKQKKQHELDRVVELVRQMSQLVDVDSVVDVGAGIGHLSRMLTLHTNMRVLAIEGDNNYTVAAKEMDQVTKTRLQKAGMSMESELVRFTSLVTEELAEKIDEFAKEGAILVGLHACGDLSTTILDVFARSKKAKGIILAGCCYHKQFQCFNFYREKNPGMSFDAFKDEGRGVFPVSKKWAGARLTYLERELACHNNENRVFNPLNYAMAARAHLEMWIRAAVPDGEDHMNMGLCGVKVTPEMTFRDYIEKAMAKRGADYLDHISTHDQDTLNQNVISMTDESIEKIDLLRSRFAPMIESTIIDDRLQYLLEKSYKATVIPIFDPRISARNLMTSLEIEGIDVEFPFEPYECQKKLMREVIRALHLKCDAALESPTGTGKTLSLLCSVIAWVNKQKYKGPSFDAVMQMAASHPDAPPPKSSFVPTIYYCSRTHSQLEQVVHELNRTMYKGTKASVIGSRDHFCINQKVKSLNDQKVQAHACRKMVSTRSCQFFNRFDSTKSEKMAEIVEKGRAMDIEELVQAGKEHGMCPYFISRQRQETAEIVLLPYNYVIDAKLRRRYKLDLRNSIVIFDEAHNLESICESNASTELTSAHLALAIVELQKALAILIEEEENARYEADNTTAAFGSEEVGKKLESKFRVEDAAHVLKQLFSLEEELDNLWSHEALHSVENLDGKSADGIILIEMLEKMDLDAHRTERVIEVLHEAIDYLIAKGDEAPLAEKGDGMEKVRDFLLSIFSTHAQEVAAAVGDQSLRLADRIDPKQVARHCKLFMKKESAEKSLTVKYFCFQASVSMRMLKMRGVRNVLLASGTLSPIEAFTHNMGLNFGALLENEHAMKNVPVLTSIVTRGLKTSITGSYAFRANDDYRSDIGESLMRVMEKVPQGVIIFFASYTQMEGLVEFFKRSKRNNSNDTYWEKMCSMKEVVIEPRSKDQLGMVRAKYVQGVQTQKGAAFLAVCRGKVSEGIDFADAESRAVVVVGLPYPPVNDERVVLKKVFLDDAKGKNKKHISTHDQDTLNQNVISMTDESIEKIDLLRSRFAPMIESTIIDDRLQYLLEKSYKATVIPIFDPRISARNLMTSLEIEGIDVEFPFEPYECQKKLMREVIRALHLKCDAALESPTGTGKTLSLLCSVIAWVNKQKYKGPSFDAVMQMAASHPDAPPPKSSFVPTIYYCSRTHSQLEQVVHELNRTMYKGTKASVIGSRDHFCINQKVKSLNDQKVQAHACRKMVSTRSCQFFNRFDSTKSEKMAEIVEKGRAMDIEELVQAGKEHGMCPYFISRQRQETAEIVLLPYNYVIDAKLRRRYKLDLRNSIVIFDEAHNLESICESNASTELTSAHLALAIVELQKALAILIEEEENARYEADNTTAAFGSEEVGKKLESKFRVEDAAHVLKQLFSLEEELDNLWSHEALHSVENLDGKSADGIILIEMLEKMDLDAHRTERVIEVLHEAIDYLIAKGDEAPLAEKGDGMEKVRDFLLSIFSTHAQEVAAAVGDQSLRLADRIDPKQVARHCKLFMKKESAEKSLTVKYFCFQASVSMRMLKMRGVRNVLLASGTLSPIEAFTHNMGLNFGALLENEHAMKNVPVLTSIVTRGLKTSITGSYAFRANDDYRSDIGESLMRVMEKVPQGVIIFFASYTQMEGLVEFFKRSKRNNSNDTYWEKMCSMKEVVIEPRSKDQLGMVRAKYVQGVQTQKGAAFLAVCRGKVSEGIDFADAESRAVVVVGLPYPPVNDERVVLKKVFLDDAKGKNKKGLSSRDWYQMEALRAVNQAIGRVLRHKDDFGVVLLLDSRYSGVATSMFPKWLRGTMTKDPLETCMKKVEVFFKERDISVEKSRGAYTERVMKSEAVTRKTTKTGAPIRSRMGNDQISINDLFHDAEVLGFGIKKEMKEEPIEEASTSTFRLPTETMEAPATKEFRFQPKCGQTTLKRPGDDLYGKQPQRKKIVLMSSRSKREMDSAAENRIRERMNADAATVTNWMRNNRNEGKQIAAISKAYRSGTMKIEECMKRLKLIFLPEKQDLYLVSTKLLQLKEDDEKTFVQDALTIALT